ncbi:MAG: rod shape-determining protein MreD [Gammaproteobacteria bacterium]|nr:rod shape-determining protein MreD [Gammaproteobacteria bacterium]|tara:strand:- start:1685 stop:2173 length:489 start_codon:yes stop_codon:yes gene_type:complete
MSLYRHRGGWVIAASFVVALMLTALKLPEWALIWRPAWVALVLIYWCMAVPHRIGVAIAFLLGVFLDVMSGALLGQHALALTVVAFATHKLHRRVRVMPLWQQGVSIFVLMVVYQGMILWINGALGVPFSGAALWTLPLTSMLLWPWVFVLLRDVRRKYSVT